MEWTEFYRRLTSVFEEFGACWSVDEDSEGQIVIYTGLKDKGDTLARFEGEE